MAEFKFFCPQCGQQIPCDAGYVGTQINCPACHQAIVVPQMPPYLSPRQGATAPVAGRQLSDAPVVQPPVPAKLRALRNILVIAASVVVLASLGLGGWFGYSKYKRGHLPSGLVGLWSGEGGGNDSVGGNKAMLTDISFAEGKVGQAFSFNGTGSAIKIPANRSLNVGTGPGFTIMAWINPATTATLRPIVEWNTGGNSGVHFWMSADNYGGLKVGSLDANLVDTSGGYHSFSSEPGLVVANQFQHVALTYDKSSEVGRLYLNGLVITQQNLGIFTPKTSYNSYLGNRPGTAYFWSGLLDEISLYNRALSASEIQAIYAEQK